MSEKKTKRTAGSESAVNGLVSFSVWDNLKWILSNRMLLWSSLLLPNGTPEQDELLLFINGYLKRSLARHKKKN